MLYLRYVPSSMTVSHQRVHRDTFHGQVLHGEARVQEVVHHRSDERAGLEEAGRQRWKPCTQHKHATTKSDAYLRKMTQKEKKKKLRGLPSPSVEGHPQYEHANNALIPKCEVFSFVSRHSESRGQYKTGGDRQATLTHPLAGRPLITVGCARCRTLWTGSQSPVRPQRR